MLSRLGRTKDEKGQGLTEYALILAFIAGLAFMMFGSGSLKETLASTITKTNNTFAEIAAVFGGNKSYSYYFEKWRTASRDALSAESNADRIEADKLGLAIIARQLLTLDVTGVQKFMSDHAGNVTSGYTVAQYSADSAKMGEGGYSDVMIPLSYRAIPIDDQKDFFWLDSNKNQFTVGLLDDDIKVYDKSNKDASTYGSEYSLDNKKEARTRSTDRFFYSDDMITNSDSNNDQYYSKNARSIALRVHYDETGHVDHVNIAAVKGKNGNGDIAERLNLKVTNDSITERNGPL